MKRIITMGEIMQRLTPPQFDRLEQCTTLQVAYGGSEANIAIALSNFGHDVSFATKVPEHALGRSVIQLLNKHKVKTEHVLVGGDTLGSYYVEKGYSVRPSQVIYNRRHSSFANVKASEFNIDSLLEGKDYLHISGITLALGKDIKEFTINLIKTAFNRGLTISFDFNYRAKLWSVDQAASAIREILPYVHICFASLYDIEVIGGYAIPEGTSYESVEEKRYHTFKSFMRQTNCRYIFGTMRTQLSTHENRLQAYCYTELGEVYFTKQYDFEIIDRVGGGDAFVAGVLHKLQLSNRNYEESVEYGVACGVLKHTMNGDILLTNDEEVEELIVTSGCAGIKR